MHIRGQAVSVLLDRQGPFVRPPILAVPTPKPPPWLNTYFSTERHDLIDMLGIGKHHDEAINTNGNAGARR